jgi:hypothetical protein
LQPEQRKRWKKNAIWVVSSIVVGWLIYVEALNLIAWHFARQTALKYPNLAVLPEPLPDRTVAELSGITIEHFGFSFQVPWKNIDKQRDFSTISLFNFGDGPSLIIYSSSTHPDLVTLMRNSGIQRDRGADELFGSDALRSSYDLAAAELHAQPTQARWWANRRQNVRTGILLGFKGMYITDADQIYDLNYPGMRGFQLGDPAIPPYKVKLDLYDKSDRHYEIVITGKDRNHPFVSQAEINAIAASLHSTEASPNSSLPTRASATNLTPQQPAQ